MTDTFKCASCSAPLEFEGKVTQKCQFCGSTVIVPAHLFHRDMPGPTMDIASLTGGALKIAEIQTLIHDGKKAEAVELFRETFGVGTAEAQNAIDRLERDESIDISGMRVQPARRVKVNAQVLQKVGITVGGSLAASVVIIFLVVFLVAGGIVWGVWSVADRTITKPTALRSAPAEKFENPPATELLRIGGEGNGGGRFKDNRHVAVDGTGRIYSADYNGGIIQSFDSEGKFLTQWTVDAKMNLYGLAADRSGNVYVGNNHGIFKYDGATGRLLASLEKVSPSGLAIGPDGKIYFTRHRAIMVLDPDLKQVAHFKDAAELASATFGLGEIAIDGGGNIYAFDDHTNEICKFSPEGKFLNRIPAVARSTNSFSIDPAGRFFVSDTNTVYVLDPAGKQIGSFPTSQAFGIAFDQAGSVYVASRPNVVKYQLNF
jgi:DNA-binding beta-propeller fold protein YncE